MMKITYNELNEIIGHVGKIMYAIHKIPFVWVNFESDEGIELNKEPLNLLELGENKDIIMKLQDNYFTEENTDSYHRALDFLREIKTELQNTPMEKEEYIRIEFFF